MMRPHTNAGTHTLLSTPLTRFFVLNVRMVALSSMPLTLLLIRKHFVWCQVQHRRSHFS